MLWKENCCGSSVTCRDPVVVEAVVLCVLCVSLAVCCAVAVRCSVGCGSVVVVGARGGAGIVVGSSLLPREVVGVVATAGDTATQTVGSLDVDVPVVLANPVVALVAKTCGTCLVEEVEAGSVEEPVAKAKAARC